MSIAPTWTPAVPFPAWPSSPARPSPARPASDRAPHRPDEPSRTRFEGLSIDYCPQVLAPRPWTALQSRWATELLHSSAVPSGPVLELCAGVGYIGLAAVAPTTRRLVQVDGSRAACRWARRNATAAHLLHRVEVRCGDVAEALHPSERFALVIADPPYVPRGSLDDHPEDPLTAIDGGHDGLAVTRKVVEVATAHLAPAGAVLLQARGAAQLEALVEDRQSGVVLEEVREVDAHRAVGLLRPRQG